LDPWDNHRSCTRYDYRQRQQMEATAADEDEARRRHAKASLDRYLHHYERWAGDGKSLQKALADADELERSELERMARMVDVPAMELGFVTEAYRQIADGRRVLRWAHAYAYFLFLDPERDAAKRDLFDDLQSEADRWLECLHSCAELERKELFGGGADGDGESTPVAVEAFRAYKEKVANLTGVTRKFMGNLVKAFKTNLPEVVVTPPAFDFDHIGKCNALLLLLCI
jgi:ariadne-1